MIDVSANFLQVMGIPVIEGRDFSRADELSDIDPAFPFDVEFYDTIFDRLYHKEENLRSLITVFSILAIIISLVGVFGLVIFETQYRRKEISIRKVHGAAVGEILYMFNKSYLKVVCIGGYLLLLS